VNRLQRVFVTLTFVSALFAASYALCSAEIEATLLEPPQGSKVSGGKVEIAVGYNTGSVGPVTRMELSVDDAQCGSKVMDAPRTRGVVSFLWDSRLIPNGKHKFQVGIYAGSKLLKTLSSSLTSSNQTIASHTAVAKFESIKSGNVLSGSADIKVSISGMDSNPMVAVLVDKIVKGIRNHPPYSFSVTTTDLSEGRHVLEAYALDEAGNRVEAQPLEVVVQNKAASQPIASTPPKIPGKTQVTVVEKPVPKQITPPTAKTPATIAAKTPAPKPPVVTTFSVKPGTTTTAVKPVQASSARKTTPPVPAKAAANSLATTPVKPLAPTVAVQTPSTTTTPTVKPPTAQVAKATTRPTTKVVQTATPRSSMPPVKMAAALPGAEKARAESGTSVTITEPKPEPQDSVPPVKPAPATPRVAQTTKTTTPATPPTLTKPTVAVAPNPKPAPPSVAKTTTASPVKAVGAKPMVVAKNTEPAATDAARAADESRRNTQRMMDVSLRWALQMAGLKVSVDDGQVIKGSDGAKTMEFQVGEREVLVGDHVVVLPSPVTSVGGRAMIPLSFIVEQLGLALKDPSLMKPRVKAN